MGETRVDLLHLLEDLRDALVESTVWVNDAHPAYRRAVASRSEGYHLALSVAMALAPLAVEADPMQRFVTFLVLGGRAVDRATGARRSRGRRGS